MNVSCADGDEDLAAIVEMQVACSYGIIRPTGVIESCASFKLCSPPTKVNIFKNVLERTI